MSTGHRRGLAYGIALLSGAVLLTACTPDPGADLAERRSSSESTTGPNSASRESPATSPDPLAIPVAQNRALLQAANDHDPAAVRAALTRGAQVDTRDTGGRTPLMLAVLSDDLSVAQVLLEFGADPDAKDARGETPWVNTGVTGSVPMMEALLPFDPDLTLPNRFGGNALIPAAEKGHLNYVREVLRQTGIDIDHVNDLGWTALLEAVYYGDGGPRYRDIVRVLVDNGADLTIRDANGRTAFDHAVRRGFTDIAALVDPR
ncbi:ankyrin repeat domain-containing protein [Nocardia sp. NPDC005978]|uniref:ankyrin repeat domain-containing protein n=1 Tax=Nocardia sp. NPDC005978 TaxID=3156725 RepID=UPI0033A5D458